MQVKARSYPPSFGYSADGRVRVKMGALLGIVFEHVLTAQDLAGLSAYGASEHIVMAGLTEWKGAHEGRHVTLGWDFLVVQDGALIPDKSVGPRTNLLLLDPKGYDRTVEDLDELLWDLIATLPWKQIASQALWR